MADKPAKKTEFTKEADAKKGGNVSHAPKGLTFSRENYMLMLLGIVVLIIGFALMSGPASGDIFSFRRITLAPIVVLIGFVIEIFAIFRKPKEDN